MELVAANRTIAELQRQNQEMKGEIKELWKELEEPNIESNAETTEKDERPVSDVKEIEKDCVDDDNMEEIFSK